MIETVQKVITLWGVFGYFTVFFKFINKDKMERTKKGEILYFLIAGPIVWFIGSLIIIADSIVNKRKGSR